MADLSIENMTLSKVREKRKKIDMFVSLIDFATVAKQRDPMLLSPKEPFSKHEKEFMLYQRVMNMVKRNQESDRVFNLETVEIKGFNTKHGEDIDTAIVHTGPYADEYARAMNAVAVTIGTNIFFRNGAYKPETEEGRMVLAHELTHVAQYQGKRITTQTTKEELEVEATEAEKKAEYDPDPYVSIPVDDGVLTIRQSKYPQFIKMVADEMDDWLEYERNTLSEEEYLKLLCAYNDWLNEEAI